MHTVAAKSRWLAPIFIVWVLVALGVSDRAVAATFDEGGGRRRDQRRLQPGRT